ncbi:hypothetical protein ACK6D9_20215 [Hoeflea sp. Naph1]|uniref:hypothetical protein n=1 Tax=Hoeflea sp. Naph1 TaxID=3388653 RepID=UPI0039901014
MTVFYCIEDELSRVVAERLIRECCPIGTNMQELGKAHGGFGYIRKNLQKFHSLAQRSPVLIITDLDRGVCAPSLRNSWLQAANILEPLPENMLFCIAQTEIESWLLADTKGISTFLKVSPGRLTANIETSTVDSKEYLVRLAMGSSNADIRRDLTPAPKSTAPTGLSYNFRLSQFVCNDWNPREAAANSFSLRRAITKLSSLNR